MSSAIKSQYACKKQLQSFTYNAYEYVWPILRSLLFMVASMITASGLASCSKQDSSFSNAKITVVSYGGGAYQESHRIAFCKPFSNLTGAKVSSVVWNADYGKLKAMVSSGRVSWDVVEVTAAQFSRGQKDNLFEKLTILPKDGEFLEGTVSKYGVANVYWGTVLAYNKEKFSTKPKNWADFWDVVKFPGSRALYDDPRGNLEFALLASGVSKEKLYPIDVDRAFKKLDEIKPHVKVWWTDGSQPIQLLLTGSVDMTSAWNGRIYASPQARESIGYIWNGAALELDYWIIPKGSRNKDLASRFIYFASLPYTLARQVEFVGYGPVNITALKFIEDRNRIHFPTYAPNWDVSFVVDANWWAENEETVKTRWINWKGQ